MRNYVLILTLMLVAQTAGAQSKPISLTENTRKVILNDYDTNYEFHDGLLAVKNGETHRWGFIDEQGNKVVDYKWEYKSFAYPQFGGGACLVCRSQRDGLGIPYYVWYVIDKQGRAIKLNGNVVDHAPYNDDGYAIVVKKLNDTYAKCTYIDSKGREVFPSVAQTVATLDPECPERVRPFSDGLAAFRHIKKRRYGFIDKAGRIVCQPDFLEVQDFSEGMAAVKVEDNGGRWGFIDTSGRMVIPPKFSNEPYPFRDGKASVEKRDGSVVMIDKTGSVVGPVFKDIRNFYLGYAYAQFEGKRYLDIVDENFEIVREQVEGKRLEPRNRKGSCPIEFINGYSTWEGDPGFSLPLLLSPIGKELRFKSNWGENIDVAHRTDKIIHVKLKEYDGFIDYDGNMVFYFAEEEF